MPNVKSTRLSDPSNKEKEKCNGLDLTWVQTLKKHSQSSYSSFYVKLLFFEFMAVTNSYFYH